MERQAFRTMAWFALAVLVCCGLAAGPVVAYQVPPGVDYVTVSPASFWMGQDYSAYNGNQYWDEGSKHWASVYWPFAISKYEVTYAEYAEFLNAVGVTSDAEGHPYLDTDDPQQRLELSGTTWIVGSDPKNPSLVWDDMPMVEVTWYGAKAYCEWMGGRLPTEEEWELAARGTEDDPLTYPWGEETPSAYNPQCSFWQGNRELQKFEPTIHTMPVGFFSKPPYNGIYDSPYGAADMAGNVWEWTMGGYDSYPGAKGYPCPDPQGYPIWFYEPLREVTRGGSWTNSDYNLRCAVRSPQPRYITDANIGFRVVWSDNIVSSYVPAVPVIETVNQWIEEFDENTQSTDPNNKSYIDEIFTGWWYLVEPPTFSINTAAPGYFEANAEYANEYMAKVKRDTGTLFSPGDYVDITVRLMYNQDNRGYARSSVAVTWTDLEPWNGTIRPGGRGADENTGYPWYLIANNSDKAGIWHEVTCERVKWGPGLFCIGVGLWRNPIDVLVPPMGDHTIWVDRVTVKHSQPDYPVFGHVVPEGVETIVTLTDTQDNVLASAYANVYGDYKIYYPGASEGDYKVVAQRPGYNNKTMQFHYTEASVRQNIYLTPPTVVSTTPKAGCTVRLNSTVSATFSQDMLPSTITSSTFVVKDSGNNPVAGEVTYDVNTRTATFTPNGPFSNAMTYTATITTGVQDTCGWNMASNYVWNFVTPVGAYHVMVDSDAPGPVHDGTSWNNAFLTIAEAINAVNSGEEVWVAAGTYIERITLKNGVGVYGGFAGNETQTSQRNWAANRTIIDGNAQGTVVTTSWYGDSTTAIDGFTIQNGNNYYAGGINCYRSSIRIANNIIQNNRSTVGGGLYLSGSYNAPIAPILTNNVIVNNHMNPSSLIQAGGIYMDLCNATITNNTIANNEGNNSFGGISLHRCDATIKNNIIAFNSGFGIGCASVDYGTELDYNNVYGNEPGDYAISNHGLHSISVDPMFYDMANGDFHLTYGSGCIDAGLDIAPEVPAYDKDKRTRILGSAVDIGAYEYRRFCVSTTGSDTNDGSDWAQAKACIRVTAEAASEGDEIWVAEGAYGEYAIPLKDGMKILGGFAGSGTTRDWNAYPTSITAGYATWSSPNASPTTVLEGFTITGMGYYLGGGCINAGSPTITHNVFANCYVSYGGGAIIVNSGSPHIINNVFSGCHANQGGAIFVSSSGSPLIVNNTFEGNWASMGGAIYIYAGAPVIANNIIYDTDTGYGIYNNGGNPTITNNCLYDNLPGDYYGVSTSTGDVLADPQLTSDWHISSGSPCIDAGGTALRLPIIDMDTDLRPYNGIIDIGADEYLP